MTKTLEEYIADVLSQVPGAEFRDGEIWKGDEHVGIDGLTESLADASGRRPQPWWWVNQYARKLNHTTPEPGPCWGCP